MVAGAWLGRNDFFPKKDPAVKPYFKEEHKDAFITIENTCTYQHGETKVIINVSGQFDVELCWRDDCEWWDGVVMMLFCFACRLQCMADRP